MNTAMVVRPTIPPGNNSVTTTSVSLDLGKRRVHERDGSFDDNNHMLSSNLQVTTKRQKLPSGKSIPEHIGDNELASAFALASLASMSPKRYPPLLLAPASPNTAFHEPPESRQEETEYISPMLSDVRSPVRSPNHAKRVTFSNDTRDISRQGSRKFSLPHRSRRRGSPPHHHPPSQQSSSFPPAAPWLRPRLMDHHHPGSYAMPPPPPPGDKWICDYCNVAAFDTFQEACAHEEMCRVRYHQYRLPPPQHHGHWPVMPHSRIAYASQNNYRGEAPPLQSLSPSEGMFHPTLSSHGPSPPPLVSTIMGTSPPPPNVSEMGPPAPVPVPTGSRTWFEGSTSLAILNSDSDWLSALNCYIREECVEAFSASEDDVCKISKRGRITYQQVGIRCRFCKHRPRDEALGAATSYPVSLAGIYESVKRWQKMHLEVCGDVPPAVRAKLQELASGNSWVPTTRQYWADSAKALGMVDTQDGIRFGRDPSDAHARQAFAEELQKASEKPENSTEDEEMHKEGTLANGESIVYSDDMPMVPPYVYFLMRQVEATHFTESDRFVARSKGPVGYSGFQCRHCKGHAGLGRYFPVSSKSLSTNSTSQNIHSHLLKCRKVSPYIKEQLITLKDEKSKAPRLEPGWRRVFFEKIWSRLHGPEPIAEV